MLDDRRPPATGATEGLPPDDARPDARPDACPDARPDVGPDVRPDVGRGARADVRREPCHRES
ncbi:MAG TPA: hypothetical protein PK838_03480, partial [Thermoleophilia bacterium]|nr:hypothetical protein [Thermoleophilia bacterium]